MYCTSNFQLKPTSLDCYIILFLYCTILFSFCVPVDLFSIWLRLWFQEIFSNLFSIIYKDLCGFRRSSSPCTYALNVVALFIASIYPWRKTTTTPIHSWFSRGTPECIIPFQIKLIVQSQRSGLIWLSL